MNVTVGEAISKSALDGEYSYQPNPTQTGGEFVLTSPERLRYYFLAVNGVALGGVWIDRGDAERDAKTLRTLLAQVPAVPITAPLPLYADPNGEQLAGWAAPLDVWGWYGGQPLASVELMPVVQGGNGILDRGEVWIDPVTGAALARLTDDELEPCTDENGEPVPTCPPCGVPQSP